MATATSGRATSDTGLPFVYFAGAESLYHAWPAPIWPLPRTGSSLPLGPLARQSRKRRTAQTSAVAFRGSIGAVRSPRGNRAADRLTYTPPLATYPAEEPPEPACLTRPSNH